MKYKVTFHNICGATAESSVTFEIEADSDTQAYEYATEQLNQLDDGDCDVKIEAQL